MQDQLVLIDVSAETAFQQKHLPKAGIHVGGIELAVVAVFFLGDWYMTTSAPLSRPSTSTASVGNRLMPLLAVM